jgi:tetratricopeptide (TPR) repeat protein
MLAPKIARKMVDKSQKAVRQQRLSDAEAFLKSAVQEYPKYAEAWFDLAQVYEKQERAEEAYGIYHEAIQADRLYVKPYLRLAQLALARQQWREAVDMSEQVLTLDPITLIEGYYINALAHLNLSELEIAETRARRGQRLDFMNRCPQFYLILANILALRRDNAGSMRELRNYLKAAPNSSNAELVRSQLRKMEEQARAGG